MSPDSGVYSQEALLDESAWLEGFARSLVADPSEAEDLSQDTLLTALQSQPEQRSGLRPWLARVLRNNAHRRAKRGRQRREREAQVYREEAQSAEELLERAETRRNVIHAVRSLPEPYKTAVMLRYWEELPPREIGRDLEMCDERLDQTPVVAGASASRPGSDRSIGDRERFIRDDARGHEFVVGAETRTAITRTLWAVEGEQAGADFRVGDAAVDASLVLGESPFLRLALDVEDDETIGQACGRLDRFSDAPARIFLGDQSVDDDVDLVRGLPGEGDFLVQLSKLAVDARTHEALARELAQLLAKFAFSSADHRSQYSNPRATAQCDHAVGHLLDGLTGDRFATAVAVWLTDARVEQAQVIVDFSRRSDR